MDYLKQAAKYVLDHAGIFGLIALLLTLAGIAFVFRAELSWLVVRLLGNLPDLWPMAGNAQSGSSG